MPNPNPLTFADGAEIPDELLMNEIFSKISDGACLARCRCVCRAWRHLLSGPSLIRHSLHSSPPSDYQIMVSGCGNHYCNNSKQVYGWYSPATLEPLLPHRRPTVPDLLHGGDVRYVDVAGCCNGLFCLKVISTVIKIGLVLWNPATSETKLLPPSLLNPHKVQFLPVGFGFDSEKNDYKVFKQDGSVMEVYSLRENSWRILEGWCYRGRPSHAHIPICHEGKLYWREKKYRKSSLLFHSVDISSEDFERVEVDFPDVAAGGEGGDGRGRLSDVSECFFSDKKESLVALLSFSRSSVVTKSHEVWMLLKCWAAESWIKLFVVMEPPAMHRFRTVESFGNLRLCFFAAQTEYGDGHEGRVSVFDLETGELRDFETVDGPYQIITYVPSRVSLRDYC